MVSCFCFCIANAFSFVLLSVFCFPFFFLQLVLSHYLFVVEWLWCFFCAFFECGIMQATVNGKILKWKHVMYDCLFQLWLIVTVIKKQGSCRFCTMCSIIIITYFTLYKFLSFIWTVLSRQNHNIIDIFVKAVVFILQLRYS